MPGTRYQGNWVKSLAVGGVRRGPKTLGDHPAFHQLKTLFLYGHVLASSFLSFVTYSSFGSRSTFSPLPFFSLSSLEIVIKHSNIEFVFVFMAQSFVWCSVGNQTPVQGPTSSAYQKYRLKINKMLLSSF